jgi:hypothetical protein
MSGGPLKLSLGQALACRRVHHGHVRPRVATKSVNSTIDFRSDFVDMTFPVERAFVEEYALFIAGEYGEIAVARATFLWLWGTQF